MKKVPVFVNGDWPGRGGYVELTDDAASLVCEIPTALYPVFREPEWN